MNCNDLGHLAMKIVLTDMHTTFPLVYRLVELAFILPVATATVERAFSAMSTSHQPVQLHGLAILKNSCILNF